MATRYRIYSIGFAHGISQEEQEGIYQDLCNRNDPTSLIEGFAFGREDPWNFPPEAIGTEAYVKKGWHEPDRYPHFTVELRYTFLYGEYKRVATAHVYKDWSETIEFAGAAWSSRWYKKYRDQRYIFWDTRLRRPQNILEPPGGPLPRYALPSASCI
ncbi:hypothetical protein COCVIDRAFT_23610 [Bipolaris victoriae FI3]|uniref:Uncharacterized protein n=1 Tax=Bipolaris victoriae (strain FI3) TaxID=930091 RepID=W7EUH7_BIPV3|nr:hypothetical protein COCVIDRAFT_23610 [Bipolaris victoriae FI3]